MTINLKKKWIAITIRTFIKFQNGAKYLQHLKKLVHPCLNRVGEFHIQEALDIAVQLCPKRG